EVGFEGILLRWEFGFILKESPRIFISRQNEIGGDLQPLRQRLDEAMGRVEFFLRRRGRALGRTRVSCPYDFSSASATKIQRPPRKTFTRVRLPKPQEDRCAWRQPSTKLTDQAMPLAPFGGPERLGIPFRLRRMFTRVKRRLATERQDQAFPLK